jgi:hypothetical protein
MKSHRRRHRRIRALILAFAACAALAAPAAAEPGADYPQPSSAKIGDTPADFAQPPAPAPKAGDTPADFAQRVAPAPKAGDTPADFAQPIAPTPKAPPPGEATDTGGFDWASAAIGAGGAGVLIVVSLGGTALASRRRMRVAP